MKHILQNKRGVTLLEGLIALLLLAVIAVGTFGVLLSTSRRASDPDIRAEMILAVERAKNVVREATVNMDTGLRDSHQTQEAIQGLINKETQRTNEESGPFPGRPSFWKLIDKNVEENQKKNLFIGSFQSGSVIYRDISELLPTVCDPSNSYFQYAVTPPNKFGSHIGPYVNAYESAYQIGSTNMARINFYINCNGYTL